MQSPSDCLRATLPARALSRRLLLASQLLIRNKNCAHRVPSIFPMFTVSSIFTSPPSGGVFPDMVSHLRIARRGRTAPGSRGRAKLTVKTSLTRPGRVAKTARVAQDQRLIDGMSDENHGFALAFVRRAAFLHTSRVWASTEANGCPS
jgi:hypothetical protein